MSVYNTGTATFASGLTTVSGYGTSWLANVDPSDLIMKRGDSVAYTIAGVTSNTELSLNTTFPGPTVSGSQYDIFSDFTVNANLAKIYGSERSDWPTILGENFDRLDDWAIGWNRTPFTCTFVGAGQFYCSGDKTSVFTPKTRLKIVHGGGTGYGEVVSGSYSTTTLVTVSGLTLQTPISRVYHSLFPQGGSSPFPQKVVVSGLFLPNIKTPSSSSMSGNRGEICWDGSYMYLCVAENTWKRISLDTF